MSLQIVEVSSKKQQKQFIKLPWKIYKNDPFWVPPLISEMKKTLKGENNSLHSSGPFTFLLAEKDQQVVGRMLIGVNEKLNAYKGFSQGYFSLFESINDLSVVQAMFDYAYSWLKVRGVDHIVGPLTPPSGDDNRGVVIDNFEDPPQVMNVYNPAYYPELFKKCGFDKYLDFYGFYFDLTNKIPERFAKVANYAQKKYKFRIDPLNLDNIEKEMVDVKKILDVSMPTEWPDWYPPTAEEIAIIGRSLKAVAVPDLIYIARNEQDEPIGFSIMMPNYNEALRHLNGRLLPFGFFKFLWYKRKIISGRIFTLFVIPEYRKKGVTGAIYLKTFEAAHRKGYTFGEASTIAEFNPAMRRDAEGAGGKIYKTFRIYKKSIASSQKEFA